MTQSINVNGTVLSYREEGSGTPLVLVHGFCGSSEYWQHLVAPLSRQFRVIMPNLLRNTDRPVLLVAGEKDQIIPVHKAFALEAPHVTPVLIPGAGHMSMLEAPETLMAAIRQFADKWVDKI